MLEYYSMATMVNEDMLSKAQYLSEALTRVPLIVKPAVSLREGKKVRTPISTVELASICLRAAGLELPDGVLPSDLNDYLGDDSAAGEKYCSTSNREQELQMPFIQESSGISRRRISRG